MSISLPINDDDRAEPPVLCRLLRTKATYGTLSSIAAPWTSTTASYRCLATMESVGPDDAPAHADTCRAGRRCFQHPKTAEFG